jgi:excisionase family DNA binding protein
MTEVLLTIIQVAEITQIKVCTLRKYVQKESIPYVKLGGSVRFSPQAISDWVSANSRGLSAIGNGDDNFSGNSRELFR